MPCGGRARGGEGLRRKLVCNNCGNACRQMTINSPMLLRINIHSPLAPATQQLDPFTTHAMGGAMSRGPARAHAWGERTQQLGTGAEVSNEIGAPEEQRDDAQEVGQRLVRNAC